MTKGINRNAIPRLPAYALWMGITALCALGTLTTLVDLIQLPAREQTRAAAARQHFLIDPVSGEVLLSEGAPKEPAAATFDVATKEEPHSDTEEAPAATPPAAAETPATEPPPETTQEPTPAEPAPAASGAPATAPAAETPAPTAEPPATAPATPDMSGLEPLRTTPHIASVEAPTRTADSLVPAPAREVSETVGQLTLPKRGDKDITPASLYAHPFKRKPEQVPIAFLVTDVGLDPQSIGAVLSLPPAVSVAYSPYTRKDSAYSESLRAAGHEVWMMLPSMTDRYPNDDPGPLGLIAQMPAEEIVRRMHEILGLIPGAIGFVLPANEAIGARKNALDAVLAEINTRGLFLLSGNPVRTIDQLTSDRDMKRLVRRADLVLDPEADETQIQSRLAGIPAAAKEKGQYLVVVSSRPQSLRILGEWLKQNPLKEAPYALAPVSALYQAKAQAEAAPAEAAPEESGGHGGGGEKKKEKEKKKPKEKPKKPLPQDEYLKPAGGDKKEGGGHGGGGH